MHEKVVSLTVGEQEGVASSYPVMIALTESGKVYIRKISTYDTSWEDISITAESTKKKEA